MEERITEQNLEAEREIQRDTFSFHSLSDKLHTGTLSFDWSEFEL